MALTFDLDFDRGRRSTYSECLYATPLIKLRLSESISQSVTLSVSSNTFLKFHGNLLKTFRVDQNTCLGLVLPNQCCLIVIREK